jgi:hypothetical protein
MGNKRETKKQEIQTNTTETETAFPLNLFGNISEINTHVTGPNDTAKAAIKIKMNASFHMPSQFWKNEIDNNRSEPNINDEPKTSKNFLPSLSINRIATIVNNRLTTPTAIV